MIASRRLLLSLVGAAGALPFGHVAATEAEAVPAPDISPETVEPAEMARENVATLRRYMAALNSGDIAAAVAFYSADTRNHGRPVGKAGLTRVLTELRLLFPDYRHQAVEITAAGDAVIARNRVSGTHKGKGTLPVEGACWSACRRPKKALWFSTFIGGVSKTA